MKKRHQAGKRIAAWLMAVSYTHLDVYKRQTVCTGDWLHAQGGSVY